MKVGKTVLSIYAIIFLMVILVYTIVNYRILAGNGGWGIVAIIGLLGVGIGSLVVDRILVAIIKNPRWVNILGTVASIILSYLILKDF